MNEPKTNKQTQINVESEFTSEYFDIQISPETITVSVAIYQR